VKDFSSSILFALIDLPVRITIKLVAFEEFPDLWIQVLRYRVIVVIVSFDFHNLGVETMLVQLRLRSSYQRQFEVRIFRPHPDGDGNFSLRQIKTGMQAKTAQRMFSLAEFL
jgi:hypothetical protein